MTDDERRNLAVITEVCDAYNRHDVEGVVRHFAEDSSWLLSRGVPPEGGRARGNRRDPRHGPAALPLHSRHALGHSQPTG